MTARLAFFAALMLPLLPGAAMAAAATAAQNVNVRSGPAVSFGVVGVLQQGDEVDVRQCEGDFCQIAGAGKSGWVKATYLTRDAVQKPAAPQIAATSPAAPVTTLPPRDAAPAAASNAPPAAFPPAYDAATPAPRPRATIPDAGDDIYSDDDAGPIAEAPVPSVGDDWSWHGDRMGRLGPRGLRGDYADYSPTGDAEACFLDDAGRLAFCLRDGEGMQLPLRWEGHPLSLRNPDGLDVSICTEGDRDCRVIVADGPIAIDRPIGTISVSVPGY